MKHALWANTTKDTAKEISLNHNRTRIYKVHMSSTKVFFTVKRFLILRLKTKAKLESVLAAQQSKNGTYGLSFIFKLQILCWHQCVCVCVCVFLLTWTRWRSSSQLTAAALLWPFARWRSRGPCQASLVLSPSQNRSRARPALPLCPDWVAGFLLHRVTPLYGNASKEWSVCKSLIFQSVSLSHTGHCSSELCSF